MFDQTLLADHLQLKFFLLLHHSVEGTWFIVFIASTIITVWPFFILSPTLINFLAPGSGARYIVPIIGDLTLLYHHFHLNL